MSLVELEAMVEIDPTKVGRNLVVHAMLKRRMGFERARRKMSFEDYQDFFNQFMYAEEE